MAHIVDMVVAFESILVVQQRHLGLIEDLKADSLDNFTTLHVNLDHSVIPFYCRPKCPIHKLQLIDCSERNPAKNRHLKLVNLLEGVRIDASDCTSAIADVEDAPLGV